MSDRISENEDGAVLVEPGQTIDIICAFRGEYLGSCPLDTNVLARPGNPAGAVA